MLTRLFLLFLWVSASVRGGAPELTQDDYDIWHAAIQAHDPRRAVYVWHTVEPLEALQRITLEEALKDFPEARPTANTWQLDAAELDLRLLKAAAGRNPLPFGGGSRYALLGLDALEQLLQTTVPPKPNWILNPMLLPDADSVCRLTRPVIRSDGRVAYLYYIMSTRWWGAVQSCSLHRDVSDGTWRVDTCGRTDFTDWKDGKRIDEDPKAAHPCSCH
jgi:hypothetical protein